MVQQAQKPSSKATKRQFEAQSYTKLSVEEQPSNPKRFKQSLVQAAQHVLQPLAALGAKALAAASVLPSLPSPVPEASALGLLAEAAVAEAADNKAEAASAHAQLNAGPEAVATNDANSSDVLMYEGVADVAPDEADDVAAFAAKAEEVAKAASAKPRVPARAAAAPRHISKASAASHQHTAGQSNTLRGAAAATAAAALAGSAVPKGPLIEMWHTAGSGQFVRLLAELLPGAKPSSGAAVRVARMTALTGWGRGQKTHSVVDAFMRGCVHHGLLLQLPDKKSTPETIRSTAARPSWCLVSHEEVQQLVQAWVE